jgi:hypothetical protein
VLQLEKEKESWSQMHATTSDMEIIILANAEGGSNAEGLVHAMSHISLKTGEIKNLNENLEKLKQEAKGKDEKLAQLHRENQDPQERVNKIKTRLKSKTLLQGAKHVIWNAIAAEVAKFRSYLNFINDKDNMDATARNKCVFENKVLAKKPSEWDQNAIELLNAIPTADLQSIGVKDRTALIISTGESLPNTTYSDRLRIKLCKWTLAYRSLKTPLNNCLLKASPHSRMAKAHYTSRKIITLFSCNARWTCYPHFSGITRRSCLEAHMS